MAERSNQAVSEAGDLWAEYRKVMSRPLTPDELRGFGREETGTSVEPFVDMKIVNRRGRKGARVTTGLKGTF